MSGREGLSTLNPELNTKPRVFYRGLNDVLCHLITGNICEVAGNGRQQNLAGVEVVLIDSAEGGTCKAELCGSKVCQRSRERTESTTSNYSAFLCGSRRCP